MIGIHKTLTDYLITDGAMFHPETVIFNMTTLWEDRTRDIIVPKDKRSLPPFSHVHVEFRIEQDAYVLLMFERCNGNDHDYETFVNLDQSYHVWWVGIDKPTGLTSLSSLSMLIEFDDEGKFFERRQLHIMDDENPVRSGIKPFRVVDLPPKSMVEMIIFALNGFALIHDGCEVDFVEASRTKSRHIKRKTGKEPSPYFLLTIQPHKMRKEYPAGSGGHEGKRSMHVVRGHFRTYRHHPTISDRTVFVRPHVRGSLDVGEIKKGYRIVLPKTGVIH